MTPDIIILWLDESIDGEAFLELTNDDLTQLKIKMGPRKCILKILKETKEKENVSPFSSIFN